MNLFCHFTMLRVYGSCDLRPSIRQIPTDSLVADHPGVIIIYSYFLMFVNKNIIVYCLFKLVHCELTQETTFDFN